MYFDVLIIHQEHTEVRWCPGQETSLVPPCSNLRFFGSKCTVLKKVLATLLGGFGASDSEPGELCPHCPLVTPQLFTQTPGVDPQLVTISFFSPLSPCHKTTNIFRPPKSIKDRIQTQFLVISEIDMTKLIPICSCRLLRLLYDESSNVEQVGIQSIFSPNGHKHTPFLTGFLEKINFSFSL